MTTATHANATFENTTAAGTRMKFECIQDPGCYICNWSGHLLRVPEDGVAPGRSPLVNMVGSDPLYVTKIADNPFITLTKARMLASNIDIAVNF
jgi:hypothetical protein